MAVPKKRTSNQKRNQRRSHHALKPIGFVHCRNCGYINLPHNICSSCNSYRGKKHTSFLNFNIKK